MTRTTRPSLIVVALASAAMVAAGLATFGSPAVATAAGSRGTPGVKVSRKKLSKDALHGIRPRGVAAKGQAGQGEALPAGVPSKGRYAFLLKLSQRSTGSAYRGALGQGKAAAHDAATDQLGAVTTAQNRVIASLPDNSKVLYRAHAVMSAVAVVTDVKNFQKLAALAGVTAVYPISPKTPSNSYAVPLQGAPQAWESHSNLGADSTVAIIDTGIDYTHANFGGAGTVSAYDTAKAALGASADFPSAKVVGGYDLAGDDYNADPTSEDYDPVPSPDPYPLDCDGHGSHVAGTVAGYGENADGSTYTGSYDTSTPFSSMRIGPGMAPKAKLLAYRVFGCTGSTDLVSDAIDMAADPNGDGDTSDHADVVNLSLGSDFGSPEDGDSVATQAASALMTMVVASGNGGDVYDVGGSPGNAPGALTVAASRDAYSQDDALAVSEPASIAGDYAAERSIDYDWVADRDLVGDVARVSEAGNLDGCAALDATDAAAVKGKIAFVEWTDDDATQACGSADRADNLAAAGAIGFVYADDEEAFAAGISGSTTIPGVLVAKSAGDAIRTALLNHQTVSLSGTTPGSYRQVLPGLDDTVASFSSRGIGDAGNVKPDVTAVGSSVFSTASGTGNEGANESGTSMATPMVSGAAALVKTEHPGWTPQQTKADIMNTAGQDVFEGENHSGAEYAPQRVGSGRIQVDQALDNDVLAYVVADGDSDAASVSASFGPQAVSAPTTLHKTIRVENTGDASKTYSVAYVGRTSVPGAAYSVSPSSVTVAAGATQDVTLTLQLDPSAMTKTIDPTVDPAPAGDPRQFQADASGLVELTSTGNPSLRVPVYAAPRPVSTMTQPASLTMGPGSDQQAPLPLSGHGFDQGSGAAETQSLIAGFELQAQSGPAPQCSASVTSGCVRYPDERAADLKYVGVTSSAPQVAALPGGDPMDGSAYFAISAQGRWRTPASAEEFDIYIDGDGDGVADSELFDARLPGTDVVVSALYDFNAGDITWVGDLNDSLGDTDTAMFDSDTLVLQVPISQIPGVTSGHTRIDYAVEATSPSEEAPVDHVGTVDPDTGELTDALSFDVLHPGVTLYGDLSTAWSPVLFPDNSSSVLTLHRDRAAYGQDNGLGAMIVHFHNALGNKAQVVTLKDRATVGLMLGRYTTRGDQVTAHAWVSMNGTTAATGQLTLKDGSTTLASGPIGNDWTPLQFTAPSAGVHSLHVEYSGDSTYVPGVSDPATLVVAKPYPVVTLRLSRTVVHRGDRIKATVRVATVGGVLPTGRVTILKNQGPTFAKTTLVNGAAVLRWRSTIARSYNVYVTYHGDANYLGGTSNVVHVRVRR